MIVVVSPHLDDALLSVGAWLSWHPGAHIVTVFAGDPAEGVVTGWDSACGFATGRQAMGVRRHEDKRAAAIVGATIQHIPLLDGQYRETIPYEDGVLEATLRAVIDELAPALVLVPLGIVHSDHVAVGEAARRALAYPHRPYGLVAYEELPYRVDDPAAAVDTLAPLDVTWYHEASPDDDRAVGVKARALSQYVSQVWAIPRWSLYVPERLWRYPDRDEEQRLADEQAEAERLALLDEEVS